MLGVAEQRVHLGGDRLRASSERAASRACSSSSRSCVIRAKRRSESPDWRAPSSAPPPRISRSFSASSNPSVDATIASSRSWALSVSSSFGPETSRQYDCSAPRPTRPRSWCSWASPKRSASWTIMIVAFGTSTPTSITVVATSTSSSRALKRAIRSRRSAGFSRPCMQPTRKPFSSPARSCSASCSAARAVDAFDSSISGQTTYAWRTVRQVGAQARVGLGAALVGDPGGDDRLPARGRLRDLAHGEVAVHGERERARDRRRRHVEHVRRAALDQRRALLDAEAVLLVDDGDGEVAELEALLDQRVRADDDVRLAADLRLDRAGDERAADAELHAEALDREEVLLGERLGRRHQRALPSRLDRPQQRVERDHRLARADVALEQALHRRRPGQVGVELGDRLLLVLGQHERERAAVARDQLARRRQRRGDLLLALGRAARERELEHEQLVEREPLPPLLRLGERARLVDHGRARRRAAAARARP